MDGAKRRRRPARDDGDLDRLPRAFAVGVGGDELDGPRRRPRTAGSRTRSRRPWPPCPFRLTAVSCSTVPRSVNAVSRVAFALAGSTARRGGVRSMATRHEWPAPKRGKLRGTTTSTSCSPSARYEAQSSVRPPAVRARPVTSVPSTRQRAAAIASGSPVTAKTSRFASTAPIRSPGPGPAAARSGASACDPKAAIDARSATSSTPTTGPFRAAACAWPAAVGPPRGLQLALESLDVVEEQGDGPCGRSRVGAVALIGDRLRPTSQLRTSGLVHSAVSCSLRSLLCTPLGEVAPLVEHAAENRGVAGSSPALAIPPTTSGRR